MPALSASCTYYSATTPFYACVNTTGTGTSESVVKTGGGFTASGNFLNWLSASKFDIEKQILTGGKFDITHNILNAESRGCAGRKFIKSVSDTHLANLTFSIRGGTTTGIGSTQNQATEYGQTYIDIYAGTYNASACTSAMNDWMNVSSINLGSFQNDTKNCVGAGIGVLNGVSMWNHLLHDCYMGMKGQAQGYSTNLGPLESECQSVYASLSPSSITDPNSGAAICSSAISYVDSYSTAKTGYLGACYNSVTRTFSSAVTPPETLPCDVAQMKNYCTVNVSTNPVVDPSTTSVAGNSSAPGFILEQGLMNTVNVGSLMVQVAAATAPTGLIDKYKSQIRFGAMTFQNNGSGSECTTTSATGSIPCAKACSVTTSRMCYVRSDCLINGVQEECNPLSKTDGGKIVAYVGAGQCSVTTATSCDVDSDCNTGEYCVPSIGSHGAGLIQTIDGIPATSWTPFAEAFYNAIGYFGRTNDYTVTPPTSRSDSGFSTLPSPNTAASYVATKNPSQFKCQKNNVLLVTDGMSTADQNASSEAMAALYGSQVPYTIGTISYVPGGSGYDASNVNGYNSAGSCPAYFGSRSVSDLAWVAKNRNIKTLATTGTASIDVPSQASESISTYVVYSGPATSGAAGLCDPKTLMANTATNGGTKIFTAGDPATLYTQLDAAMSTIAAQTSSGTAASILSNSEGSGANILQAVFYPKKIFLNSTFVNWIGEMQNLWYFVDPLINHSTIREDTDGDNTLNLKNDKVVSLRFSSTDNTTWAYTSTDTNGNGLSYTPEVKEDSDLVNSIWRAGRQLYLRNLTSSPRTIYTPLLTNPLLPEGSQTGTQVGSTGLMKFNFGTISPVAPLTTPVALTLNPDNSSVLRPYLNLTDNDSAKKLMKYVHGFDFPDDSPLVMRNRTVQYTVPQHTLPDGTVIPATTYPDSSFGSSLYLSKPRDTGVGVWKLGDIITSTPRIQSTGRLNSYGLPVPGGYSDTSYNSFLGSTDYHSRGMVYAGANDGMLHAFNLGLLDVTASGFTKARLTGTGLGEEQWAYIPKQALPYLKYFSSTDYNHLFYVDGPTVVLDASIGDTNTTGCTTSGYDLCVKNSVVVNPSNKNIDSSKNTWMTVLVGSMGLGGASAQTCAPGANCVPTPVAVDPTDSSKGLGYSSYFALNVTDPNNPALLWEFSNPALGYATTGPAIVRVGDPLKNGRWYAVFGSGPTGPIDVPTHQFMGRSNQPLTFFVVDLRTGALVKTITTTIANAFAGSMVGGSIDADRWNMNSTGNYKDDAIYVGYTKANTDTITAATTWTNGGVVRIVTNEVKADDTTTPWTWSSVIDSSMGVGPVTSAIARLVDRKNLHLWLYFGTGRYYNRSGTTIDDYANQRAIYGIKDPCYNTAANPGNLLDKSCMQSQTSSSAVTSGITDQSGTSTALSAVSDIGSGGWKVTLDPSSTSFGAERVVTDAVALTNGSIFVTSFEPTSDACGYGGNSYLWALDYQSGSRPQDAALAGKALVQLSTGEFKEIDLSTAFGAGSARLMRRTGDAMTGKPPSDPFPIVSKSGNKPVKRILHIQER